MDLPEPLTLPATDEMPEPQAEPQESREMVREVTLPSGGTVHFADPEDLTGDDYGRVIDAIRLTAAQAASGDVRLGTAMDVADGVACMLIEDWTIPYRAGAPREPADGPWPLPSTDPSLLRKLKLRDYHAVLSAIDPAVRLLFPQESGADDAGRPGTPTRPASA